MEGSRPASIFAALALVPFAGFVLYLAGAPLNSDDLWFHLRMGEHFLSHGLWSSGDPMLHTGFARAPVQHEWLFGVGVHLLDRLGGFSALRIAQGLLCAATLTLTYSILRREAATRTAAMGAMAVFLVLAWWRFHQIRPHVLTIPLVFATYRLLLESGAVPSWRRVAAVTAMLAFWVNAHSGFLIGPALIGAGLLGQVLRGAVLRFWLDAPAAAGAAWHVARRLAAALALGFAATLLNPRGVAQYLTFFHLREGSVMPAQDDWPGFSPFRFIEYGSPIGPLEWALTDLLLLAFALAAAAAGWRLWRRPSQRALAQADPLRFGLGLMSVLAVLVAVRFNWMFLFVLLFLLRAHKSLLVARPAWAPRLDRGFAVLCVTAALAFAGLGRYASFHSIAPAVYLRLPYEVSKYHPHAVQFLGEAGIEGHLFNAYHMGGFLGYWLSPRLRTFIDGRNEEYPPEVFHEYALVNLQRGGKIGETFTDLLDARQVDVFLGIGLPQGRDPQGLRVYTTSHLEGHPDWVPVYRTAASAVYLRRNARNRANLERVAAYYREREIPFDPLRGLDPARVIREQPQWATAQGLVPLDHAALLEAAEGPKVRPRFSALVQLGILHGLLGAYEEAVGFERAALEIAPKAAGPRRRLVHALLRLDRRAQAVAEIRLLEKTAGDPRTIEVLKLARAYLKRTRRGPALGAKEPEAAQALLARMPLLSAEEASRLLRGRFAPALQVDPAKFLGGRKGPRSEGGAS